MKLIFFNIRNLWKDQKLFLLIIILVQALCAFCLTFIIGVMINNNKFIGFRLIDTMYINIETMIKYEEIEEELTDLVDVELDGIVDDMLVVGVVADEKASEGILSVWTQVAVENGKYVAGTYMQDIMFMQTESGRILTEEELNSNIPVAVIADYPSNEIQINDIDYDMIGVREGTGVSTAFISPINLREIDIIAVELYINRFITQEEYQLVMEAFDEVIPNGYTIQENRESEGDEKSLMKTIMLACVLIGVVLTGTLVIVYQHIMDKRNYKLAVFRLTGCSRIRSMGLLVVEMLMISIPSLLCGFGIFKWLQERYLEDVYPYMDPYLNFDVYLKLFTGMTVFLLLTFTVLSAVRTLKSVKLQLIMMRE